MDMKTFFIQPSSPSQRQYEALKSFYADGLSASDAARKFNFSPAYFKKLRYQFVQAIKTESNPFFPPKKTGPKGRFTNSKVIEEIVDLRKQNHSIVDIRTILEAKGMLISLDAIDKILKSEGFAPLPKRMRRERLSVKLPPKIKAPESIPLKLIPEEFSTEKGAGPLIFLPLIEKLGIVAAIQRAQFSQTSVLTDLSSIFSLVALKILGNQRFSHDVTWNLDRVLGFFAGLNVLPKKSTLSSYSYRVGRQSNRRFLTELSRIFQNTELEEGEFNLDFKTIPHWGDASVLEKNWSGMHSRKIKSILSLIVQDPSTGNLSYTDACIKQRDRNEAVLDFVDFWKEGRGVAPKMLIFDSKFTTYHNLSKLNEGKEKIKFLTLRRRGKKLIQSVSSIADDQWQKIRVEGESEKNRWCGFTTVIVN